MVSSESNLSGEDAVQSKSLFKPRVTAGVSLLTFMLTSGFASGAAVSRLGFSRQSFILGAVAALCLTIATHYFDDFDSDRRGTLVKLAEAGVLGALAGLGALALLEELTVEVVDFYLGVAWTSGTITASVIAVMGILFWLACDSACRNGTSISRGLLAAMGRIFGPPDDSGAWWYI